LFVPFSSPQVRALAWPYTHVLALALLVAACAPAKHESKNAAAPQRSAPARRVDTPAGVNLGAARELDQQGARAFADGRYREASRYFEEALKHGGPPAEIWNIARCEQKLDDLEAAARRIETYLEHRELSSFDREEARRELAEILRKPSRVTVMSSPSGAAVFVDDRRGGAQGRTPVTLELSPGDHVLTLELAGHDRETEQVTARYGRAIFVDATFSR
jgi:tetratricopeptide (TPR) repeat protein